MNKKFTNKKQHHEKDVIITIKRLGINGEGIGYYKKKIIFIPRDMGKIMKEVQPKLKGRADMKKVSEIIKSKLQ